MSALDRRKWRTFLLPLTWTSSTSRVQVVLKTLLTKKNRFFKFITVEIFKRTFPDLRAGCCRRRFNNLTQSLRTAEYDSTWCRGKDQSCKGEKNKIVGWIYSLRDKIWTRKNSGFCLTDIKRFIKNPFRKLPRPRILINFSSDLFPPSVSGLDLVIMRLEWAAKLTYNKAVNISLFPILTFTTTLTFI